MCEARKATTVVVRSTVRFAGGSAIGSSCPSTRTPYAPSDSAETKTPSLAFSARELRPASVTRVPTASETPAGRVAVQPGLPGLLSVAGSFASSLISRTAPRTLRRELAQKGNEF